MALTDPNAGPKRTDLPFLRHRVRPRAVVPPPSAPVAAPALTAPGVSSSLDLGETSQQLPGEAAARTPARSPSPAPTRPVFEDARVGAGGRVILSPAHPTVTLTRLQSGIGTLSFEAVCPAEVGDLRLGAAYELADGRTSTIQTSSGGEASGANRFAPPGSRRPVLVGAREQHERIQIDLRQSRDLRRLVVYAFSGDHAPLRWSGTLIGTALAGARVEVPLDPLIGGQIAVLASLYNVAGEFVLRAELQTLDGDVREAARAYGFDLITWVDGRTPVD